MALAQAAEFRDVRLKSGEKALYKELNNDSGIKFPVKVDIALPAHKVFLLIQTELGGSDYPSTDSLKKHKSQYQIDKTMVFSHINRLIRCVIDCQLHLKDAVSTRYALEIGRSLAARVWDNSSLQLKQIDQIGDVALRKLAGAGINSIETLENTEAHRIEMILGRNPPFGSKMLSNVATFPRLRVSVSQMDREREPGKGLKINFKADIGFLNETVPLFFRRKPVYVCFLAETSDGKVIEFRRFGAKTLLNGQEILLSVHLTNPTACINCHVMCDEIAGTNRYAELKLEELTSCLPIEVRELSTDNGRQTGRSPANASSRLQSNFEEFSDGELDDGDLLEVLDGEKIEVVEDIDDLFGVNERYSKKTSAKRDASQMSTNGDEDEDAGITTFREPKQLENGRWTCQHNCAEVNRNCKHKCCNSGVARRRKAPKKETIKHEEESNTGTTQL